MTQAKDKSEYRMQTKIHQLLCENRVEHLIWISHPWTEKIFRTVVRSFMKDLLKKTWKMFNFISHAKMVILGNRSALCNKSGLTVGDQGSMPTTDSGAWIPGERP